MASASFVRTHVPDGIFPINCRIPQTKWVSQQTPITQRNRHPNELAGPQHISAPADYHVGRIFYLPYAAHVTGSPTAARVLPTSRVMVWFEEARASAK